MTPQAPYEQPLRTRLAYRGHWPVTTILVAIIVIGSGFVLSRGDDGASLGRVQAFDGSDIVNVALLRAPAGEADGIPEGMTPTLELVPESSRLLMRTEEGAVHWMVRRNNSDVCLVTFLPDVPTTSVAPSTLDLPRGSTGVSCVAPEFFREHGVTLAKRSNHAFSRAVAIPDGYTQSASAVDATAAATNLIVFNDSDFAHSEMKTVELQPDDRHSGLPTLTVYVLEANPSPPSEGVR